MKKKTKKKKRRQNDLFFGRFFLFFVLFLYVFDVVCAVGARFCPSGRFGALAGKKGGKKRGRRESLCLRSSILDECMLFFS